MRLRLRLATCALAALLLFEAKTIYRPFFGKNGHFLGVAALNDHVSGFHTLQHMFSFQSGSCKIGLRGLELNTQAPKKLFFCPKMTILGLLGAKNGHSLGGVALKHPFSGLHTLQHTFVLVKHLQNRVAGP